MDPDERPDFSSNGQPIQFGFVIEYENGHTASTHGYDNWRLTIETGGSSQAEATTWGRVKTLYR